MPVKRARSNVLPKLPFRKLGKGSLAPNHLMRFDLFDAPALLLYSKIIAFCCLLGQAPMQQNPISGTAAKEDSR